MKADVPLLLLVCWFSVASATSARSQTPPLPPPPPPSGARAPASADIAHLDFTGTWTLDRTYSNDPAQANFDGVQTGSNQTPQRRGGSGGGFGGFGGFGRSGGSGSSGGRNRGSNDGGTTTDEKARLAALTDELKKGSGTLAISHHEPSFVVTNGLEHAAFCHTTGEREDQHFGDLVIPTVTRWDGDRIVTEYELSSRRRLLYTYTLLQNTRQLVLRVRMDADQGPRGNGSELKLVYRLSNDSTK